MLACMGHSTNPAKKVQVLLQIYLVTFHPKDNIMDLKRKYAQLFEGKLRSNDKVLY
jgi:hypothetical protein